MPITARAVADVPDDVQVLGVPVFAGRQVPAGAGAELDVDFLKHRTAAPYLVGPNGFYLRQGDKPLVWDLKRNAAVPHDTPDIAPALLGEFVVSGSERGADTEFWIHEKTKTDIAHAGQDRASPRRSREHHDYLP